MPGGIVSHSKAIILQHASGFLLGLQRSSSFRMQHTVLRDTQPRKSGDEVFCSKEKQLVGKKTEKSATKRMSPYIKASDTAPECQAWSDVTKGDVRSCFGHSKSKPRYDVWVM